MNSRAIIVESVSNALIIQFNRPEIRSPLSIFVLEELHKILDETTETYIIFTGKGDVFASGADLREIAKVTPETAKEFALRGQKLMNKIADKHTIAAVNGFCFGGANLGIITGWGGTQRLPRLIGQAAALEMLFTAKRVSAREALKIGLIDRISTNPLKTALELLAE